MRDLHPPSLDLVPRTASPPRDPRAYADFLDLLITRHGQHFDWVGFWNEFNNLQAAVMKPAPTGYERVVEAVGRQDTLDLASALVAEGGRLDPRPLFTYAFPLAAIHQAFATLAERPPGFVKALLLMED